MAKGEYREAAFDQALGMLYESAIAPEALPAGLNALTKLIDGDTCHLVAWDRRSGAPTLSVSHGLPVEVGPDYAARYAEIDPRRQLAMTRSPGFVLNCHEHFDKRFVERDEFFQDYLIPQVGVHYLLGAGDLVPEGDELTLIGFHRYVGHEAFSDDESSTFKRLLPHLQRALRLRHRFQEAGNRHLYGNTLLEHSNLATMAISAQGRVVWSNRHGMALLRNAKWLQEVGGRLRAGDDDRDVALNKVMRDVLASGRPGNINLARPATGEHCCVTFMRVSDHSNTGLSDTAAALLAVVTTTDGWRLASGRQLMEFFGLTPAEARLVRALASGEDLDSYALAEGIKKTTARTQLQGAFAKTSTSTQKDLVRLVISLHPVRDGVPISRAG